MTEPQAGERAPDLDDPALAWNAPIAMSCAELAAGDALAARRGIAMPSDDDVGLPSTEQEAVHHDAQAAVHAAIRCLGAEPSMKDVTIPQLATALERFC